MKTYQIKYISNYELKIRTVIAYDIQSAINNMNLSGQYISNIDVLSIELIPKIDKID